MATVIIGAGIVGVSTAYYLAEHDTGNGDIHLVETADTLFASASGFAGGFLARDWMAADAASLAALSFDQHAALAAQHNGAARWGYALSTALSYRLPGGASGGRRGEDWLRQGTSRSTAAPALAGADKSVPGWLRRQAGDHVEVLADDGTAGQVEPKLFCEYFLEQGLRRGVQLHQPARAVRVGKDDAGKLASVTIEQEGQETVLACTRLVLTAGCWTPHVFAELFPDDAARRPLPVHNYAGHSLVVQPQAKDPTGAMPCFALFAAGGPMQYCPEIFGRANGTLYLAGLNSSTIPLPATATDSVPSQDQLDDLLATCKRILGEDDVEVLRTGLCHRPATPWGAPLVLRLLDEKLKETTVEDSRTGGNGGVFSSAGHGPWGISMGPGTGMVLAEMVQGRPLSADVSGLGFH
ncbi:FAD dependent oxidoreductase superfamily [Sporothrix schenckii 1099-18]|uniref:FAD dependent oxidoreductase superfamily n=1 Tax=Sporothrix schenckii 1099-18 TaxID=1397361 RepID=A0A0F2MJ61_SPOSC|nr:FAD dependent oxidoreductase superfamily [Sporothrix schenckii 1099-18]KJR89738.1 FAD dependent oxidoreductase superfamily [Sporothrix schenckii 1099-18]